jgi:hypothetical protein
LSIYIYASDIVSRYLQEIGEFSKARSIVHEACGVLEGLATKDHPGYTEAGIRRLTADLYIDLGSIDFEMNVRQHGLQWYNRANIQRAKLIEDDDFQKFDVETAAVVDGNVALSRLADGDKTACDVAVASWKFLLESFGEDGSRGSRLANMSIFQRFAGHLDESLDYCEQARIWTEASVGKDSLLMAM